VFYYVAVILFVGMRFSQNAVSPAMEEGASVQMMLDRRGGDVLLIA